MDRLKAAYANWLENYALVAPIDGIVAMPYFWDKSQFIDAGEKFAYIMPYGKKDYMGRVWVNSFSIGKVKVGQNVVVRLRGFPYTEFGNVVGIVEEIFPIPERMSDGNLMYMLTISFPMGLKTTYGKTLPFTYKMDGNANIVVQNRRLISLLIDSLSPLVKGMT